jgi:hypothetical protein
MVNSPILLYVIIRICLLAKLLDLFDLLGQLFGEAFLQSLPKWSAGGLGASDTLEFGYLSF